MLNEEYIRYAVQAPDTDPKARAVIKWQYGLFGGFYSALFGAITRADEQNLHNLSLGFPDEVGGYLEWARGDLSERLQAANDEYMAKVRGEK